jgi:hypothetical protein
VQDAPIPPLPPMPDLPQVIVQSGDPPAEVLAVVIVIAVIAGAVLLFPLIRALARRLEGGGRAPALRAEIDQLHERLGELEQMEGRLAELENRVEFSERLLTRQRDDPRQSAPGGQE